MSTSLELMLDETKAMDAVFKNNYKVYAFAKRLCLEPEWELQVQLYVNYGTPLVIDRSRRVLFHVFIWMCWTRVTLLKLPHVNGFWECKQGMGNETDGFNSWQDIEVVWWWHSTRCHNRHAGKRDHSNWPFCLETLQKSPITDSIKGISILP